MGAKHIFSSKKFTWGLLLSIATLGGCQKEQVEPLIEEKPVEQNRVYSGINPYSVNRVVHVASMLNSQAGNSQNQRRYKIAVADFTH